MKILKLSATALIIAGANMLLSQSALACQDGGSGRCGNVGWTGNRDNSAYYGGYGNSGGGYSGGYIDKYLGLAWTKDGKPFFYNAQYRTNYGFTENHFKQSDADTLYECNKSSRRSPCKFATSWINGCIAIAKVGEVMYSDGGATCNEAKQKAMQLCQAYDSNPNACKIYKTRKS
ncbi:DUF4189 domain-containing protein [Faucicola boevrei]|uniref:DUF4189 domain-containing protein n=1 Tax=Faucicola boevrei TaxID=346665 RepID=UPI00036460D7|nr:DUF4189 domain-containing protein [Moraxella boevrei]